MNINYARWKNFCEIHSKELVPFFNAYEVRRRKIAPWILLCDILFYTLLILFITVAILGSSARLNHDPTYIFPCFFSMFIFHWIAKTRKKSFKKFLKENCMEKVLKAFGNIRYQSCDHSLADVADLVGTAINQRFENLESYIEFKDKYIFNISKDDLVNSKLFETYNKREDDDLFNGNYNGVDFRVLETNLQHESRSGKSRSCKLVFQGVIATFSANKRFTGQTIISTKGDSTGMLAPLWQILIIIIPFFVIGILCFIFDGPQNSLSWACTLMPILTMSIFIFSKKKEKLTKVELEDPVLRKHFDVHSTDQVEARYLLTPAFIQRFTNLKTAFGTKKIKCSFFENKIMFAISSSKDLFEIGHLYKSLHDPKSIYTLYNEISAIEGMIDHFKLDEKTGL